MFLETNIFLLLLSRVHLLLGQPQQQGQCSVDRLAPFGDSGGPDSARPDRDRFQAIVPAYTFQCSGRVTEWRACVQPGASFEQYYIEFQVWRRNSTVSDGECYELVGSNTPQDGENMEEFLSPPGGGDSNPLNCCVVLSVREDHQIEFQSGDVVGYYVDHEEDDSNDNDDGIQWIEDLNNVVVHYRDNLPMDDIQSYYAIGGPSPTECGFPISGGSVLYTLASSTSAAPIISLSIATSVMTSSLPPAPTSPPSVPAVVTPSPTPSSTTAPSPSPTPSISTPTNSPSSSPMGAPNTSLMTGGDSSSNVAGNTAMMASSLPPSQPTIFPNNSPSPPPISSGNNGGIDAALVAVIAAAIILILVTAGGVVLLLVVVRRRKKTKSENPTIKGTGENADPKNPTFNNPAYSDTSVTIPSKTNGNHLETSSSAPHYDYCRVPAATAGGASGGTQSEERVYATLEKPGVYEVPTGNSPSHTSVKTPSTQYDYTAIYEDPTSPSYVSEVYSSGSVFDSAGTCVPTMEARARYEMSPASHDAMKYNSLHFFERDAMFWSPASTTSGLYEQLCTKRYREISRKQIRILEQLGSGQFGTVCKGVWTYQNETMQVAVKTLTRTASDVDRVKFLQEAAIMGQFYHPNIVRLHGVVTVGDPILIVLDFMPNGDMRSYLEHLVISQDQQARLPKEFLKFGREIAAGMAYLAKKSFVHRDLAARNILLDQNMSCKVGDFGMARDLMDDTYYKSKGGQIPVKWTSPEGLLYKKYSTASDVWSYGMVLYEIWSVGKKPFQDLSNRDVIARLQNPQCLAPPPGCPRQVYSLTVDCWNPEPGLRPTFDTVFRTLRGPEELLLHWTEEDVAAGRHLLRATHTSQSFSDLQNKYTVL